MQFNATDCTRGRASCRIMLYNAKIVQGKRNNKKQLADFLFCRAADCLIKEQ